MNGKTNERQVVRGLHLSLTHLLGWVGKNEKFKSAHMNLKIPAVQEPRFSQDSGTLKSGRRMDLMRGARSLLLVLISPTLIIGCEDGSNRLTQGLSNAPALNQEQQGTKNQENLSQNLPPTTRPEALNEILDSMNGTWLCNDPDGDKIRFFEKTNTGYKTVSFSTLDTHTPPFGRCSLPVYNLQFFRIDKTNGNKAYGATSLGGISVIGDGDYVSGQPGRSVEISYEFRRKGEYVYIQSELAIEDAEAQELICHPHNSAGSRMARAENNISDARDPVRIASNRAYISAISLNPGSNCPLQVVGDANQGKWARANYVPPNK